MWVGWIVFSQTGLAGGLADWVFALFFEPKPGPVDWTHFVAQKGYHVLLFGVFGLLAGLRYLGGVPPVCTGGSVAPGAKTVLWRAVAWCVGLSVFAESLQLLSANRSPLPWDALLNIVSALGAYWLTARAAAPGSRPGSSAPSPR